jgi:hypothetical protein
MKPQTIGRALGIGLRVAGRIAGQRMAASAQAAGQPGSAGVAGPAQNLAAGQVAGRTVSQVARGAAGGVGGFLKPFRRVGGIVWLEVTGVFFALPVLVFGPVLWKTRMSWAHGPDHRTFLVTAGIVLLFFYLSVSSFWRARRR